VELGGVECGSVGATGSVRVARRLGAIGSAALMNGRQAAAGPRWAVAGPRARGKRLGRLGRRLGLGPKQNR
jgi:hypothetical protein